jgi:membrane glycosyltransferase
MLRWRRELFAKEARDEHNRHRAVPSWRRSGSRRRIALSLPRLIPTITSSYTMARLLPERASLVLDALLVAVFGILFAWISVGFWPLWEGSSFS